MRLRKIKYAAEMIQENADIVKTNPEEFQGKWNELFDNDHPIHIEVGCGKGQFIIEMAKKYPNINFIGIEKYDSVVIRGLEKYLENPQKNVLFIQKDAKQISEFFCENEIDCIYLNFSDPWPKNRQAKRRLSHHHFLVQYVKILKQNGSVKMKTDNFGLFDYSMMSFHSNPNFFIKDFSIDYHNTIDNVPTEFEEKFVSQGKSIFYLFMRLDKESTQ